MKFLNINRLLLALKYSFDGLKVAIKTEAPIQQELIAFIILCPIAVFTHTSHVEKALLIGSLLLVLIVEVINTAIETVVNLVSPDIHPLAKYAKDLGSLSVFLTILLSGLIWLSVLS